MATGAEELKPREYRYGETEGVMTLLDMDDALKNDRDQFNDCRAVVFIQCVGSRNEERPYCSRVCCSHTVKHALTLKEINPEMDVYVLYRDMRTYGLKEEYYRKASDQGVVFIRYDVDEKPDVSLVEEEGRSMIRVTVKEPILGVPLILDADRVCLAAGSVPPPENKALSQMLKVPLNEDNFFMEAHMKLRPVDFATDGIFMCGTAHSPKFIDESISQAHAAASRAATVLSREEMRAGGSVCSVDAAKCVGCGVCEEVCPFHAIAVDPEERVSKVNEALCKGCGVCASSCRSGALDVGGVSDEQTMTILRAMA